MHRIDPIVIVAARRTPIGNFNGGLATVPGHQLGATVIRTLLADTSLAPEDVSEVILGQVLTAGCGQNPARQATLSAGLPKEVPAWGINQVCGSGLKAIGLAVQAIASGQSQIVIAGGQENMSLAPHVMHMRNGTKMGNATLVDSMMHDGLWEAFHHYPMGVTAENIARQFNISRDMQDQFAYISQQKAAKAKSDGVFIHEITPVTVTDRKGSTTITEDEFPRADTTIEGLGKLRPVFDKDGTVTAGNASGINDGAAAVMLMPLHVAQERGLTPLAKVVSFGQSGVEPAFMGIGPITATRMALTKAGWSIGELDLIEANEAFAAQAIAVNHELGWDMARVNVSGGAIALGHPIGASGARILVTLLHGMQTRKAKKGLATLCIGGGMGVAMCVERL